MTKPFVTLRAARIGIAFRVGYAHNRLRLRASRGALSGARGHAPQVRHKTQKGFSYTIAQREGDVAPCVCIHLVDSTERKANNALDELGMAGYGMVGFRGTRAFTSR